MSKYEVILEIKNTGSISPKGSAKQCYLGIMTVPKEKGGKSTGALLLSKGVKNEDTVTEFKEVTEVKKLDDAKDTSTVELDLDNANGLAFTFSIYDGIQLIDNIIASLAEAGVSKIFDLIGSSIPDGFWSQSIKGQLAQWKKKLLASLAKSKEFVQIISVDTFDLSGLRDGVETYELSSDVKIVNDNFGVYDDVVIREGYLVANVKLTKVA